MKNLILITCFILSCYVAKSQSKDTTQNKNIPIEDHPPVYPGGMQALAKYLSTETHYPETAAKNNIQGQVQIAFVVEMDGKVDNVKVTKSVSPELDTEAIRVVSSMKQWDPGIQNGRPVRVSYTVPIGFSNTPKPQADSLKNKP